MHHIKQWIHLTFQKFYDIFKINIAKICIKGMMLDVCWDLSNNVIKFSVLIIALPEIHINEILYNS